MITIKPISILSENMPACIELDVHPEQVKFVADNAYSLAQAYDTNKAGADDGTAAVPYAVYEDDTMVGFAMYGYFPVDPDEDEDDEDSYDSKNPVYYFWRLLIDKNHQRRGIGAEVVRLVMEEIKRKPQGEALHCYVSYDAENIGSKTTFTNYGFEEDGRVIGGELVAKFAL